MQMTAEQAGGLLQFFAADAAMESKTTRKVLAAVPAGGSDYSPDQKSMKAIDLAWHIASAELFFMTAVVNGEFPRGDPKRPEDIKTPGDVVAWYDVNFATGLDKVKALSGEQAAKMVNFFDMMQLPAVVFLNLMIKHSVHHRGQLSAYLRPMGSKVPSIYGPSGDEGVAAAQA
jgi:uncharacterized damage-inducible protein DinB